MSLGAPRFVACGEALTDLIREDGGPRWLARPGGAPWNVARVVARLGVPSAFAGAVSRDVFGEEIVRLSAAAGLDPRFLQVVDRSPLLAVVPSAHPPRYFFVGDDSADLYFDPARLPAGWLAEATVVSFGSISLARPPLAARLLALAEACRAAGARITFDPNHRNVMGPEYGATCERMAGMADLVKLSDEDLAQLFPGVPEAEALARLRAWMPAGSILYTRGRAGMRLITPAATWEQPAFPGAVADTVGAGDACLGGWVVSWITHPTAPPPAHLAFAAATAAAACRQAGAHAPTRAEVDAVLAEAG